MQKTEYNIAENQSCDHCKQGNCNVVKFGSDSDYHSSNICELCLKKALKKVNKIKKVVEVSDFIIKKVLQYDEMKTFPARLNKLREMRKKHRCSHCQQEIDKNTIDREIAFIHAIIEEIASR